MIVHVQAADQGAIDRAAKILAGFDSGIDQAMKSAMTRAVSRLRGNTTKKIRERYAISAGNIRANENVKVKYSYGNGVQADIWFSGRKIPLYRYDGASPKYPSFDSSRYIHAMINGQWLTVHPGRMARGHVLRSTSPKPFHSGFAAAMKSGHIGLFQRDGGATSKGGDAVHEIMALSVPQMVGNEEVATKLSEDAMEKFEERLGHEIMRRLNGWGS